MATNMQNRRIVLASRPAEVASVDNFRLETVPAPTPAEGEVLVRHRFVSVDPYMRMRMNDVKSYAAPQALDQVMGSGMAGEVVESRHLGFKPGDAVVGPGGWQDFSTIPAKALRKVDASKLPLEAYLGPAGMPGVTAWYGTLKLIAPKPGQTVVVSAAAGAVGSVAGQLAKQAGARVVGVAGGAEKCRHVVEELGFDACVDYKAGNLDADFAAAAPDGVDGIFENVGGAVMDAAMRRLNPFARIALCGLIGSGYKAARQPIADATVLLTCKATLTGFIISDHPEHFPPALADLADRIASGKLVWRRTITEGLENTPAAFIGMLGGANTGKALVKVS
jgi:NADPH-dependent curcumin reductase CurA